MKITFLAEVSSVTEEFHRFNWRTGPDGKTEYDQESLGWFILLKGSWEKLSVGRERPDLSQGDPVRVTLEKWDG